MSPESRDFIERSLIICAASAIAGLWLALWISLAPRSMTGLRQPVIALAEFVIIGSLSIAVLLLATFLATERLSRDR